MNPRLIQSIPRVTLLLACPALLLFFLPGTEELLQYDRTAIASGQLWRLVTQHWLHWNADHLIWDLFVFLGLGAACELRNRTIFLQTIVLSAWGISIALWFFQPSLQICRGLSGLDSALFGMLITDLFFSCSRQNKATQYLCIISALLFAGKTIFEIQSETTLFVNSQTSLMVPVPLCHFSGFIIGVLLVTLPSFSIFSLRSFYRKR